MISEIKRQTEIKYYIAHNGKDVFHYCVLEIGQEVITGQPYLEKLDTREGWKSRGIEIGIEGDMEQLITGEGAFNDIRVGETL